MTSFNQEKEEKEEKKEKKEKQDIKEHWNITSKIYQEKHHISTDYVHYGPNCPTEDELHLLGNIEGKKIIELGCGGAQCSIAMTKKGAICTGVDFSDEQLKFARELVKKENISIELIKGDIENVPIMGNGLFDIAFSAFAFDWVQNIKRVFEEAYRLLKKNGIFVFSMSHPFYTRLPDEIKKVEDLKITLSYFQPDINYFDERSGKNTHYILPKISDLFNSLVEIGFKVENIIEPEPVIEKFGDYSQDYPVEIGRMIPSTIIFKSLKK